MGQQAGSPTHVGRHLETLLKEQGVSIERLAVAVGLSPEGIAQLLTGEQILTGDIGLLLGEYFEVSPLYWLDLQRRYWLEVRDSAKRVTTVT